MGFCVLLSSISHTIKEEAIPTHYKKYSKRTSNNQDRERKQLEALKDYLDSDENLRWYEQATPGYFSGGTIIILLFAIPWTGFSLFWMRGIAIQESLMVSLMGVPFLLIGLLMLLSPIMTFHYYKNTLYAITNKRLITKKYSKYSTILPRDIDHIDVLKGNGDIGHIFFKTEIIGCENDNNIRKIGFKRIKKLKEAELLIRELKASV